MSPIHWIRLTTLPNYTINISSSFYVFFEDFRLLNCSKRFDAIIPKIIYFLAIITQRKQQMQSIIILFYSAILLIIMPMENKICQNKCNLKSVRILICMKVRLGGWTLHYYANRTSNSLQGSPLSILPPPLPWM